MHGNIPLKIKKECCCMKLHGKSIRYIYNNFFITNVDNPCSFRSFKRALYKWMEKKFPDDITLDCGTYEGFIAHDATVQVNKNGEITQAWIKQKASDYSIEDVVDALRESIEIYDYVPKYDEMSDRMLEIPLFDMHWGICFMENYETALKDILDLISSQHWDEIVIPFGQDYFHNDSMVNNVTSKGTVIEKVDMIKAVKEGREFIVAIIDNAIKYSNNVHVIYTPGNHDRSIAWIFMQVLLERYGSKIVDDEISYRKVFTYGYNAIMVTHGDSKQATPNNLSHIFAVSYPEEFACAKNREVHAGHLHHEKEGDIFGVMIRRLSSKVAVDDWSNREDFIGTHRRFMLFEYDKNKLRSIHYV